MPQIVTLFRPPLSLPADLNWMPVLSNGHIAVQLRGCNVYKNGLYNGQHGLSHRARIPNYSNVNVVIATAAAAAARHEEEDDDDRQLSNRSSTTTTTTSYRMNHRHGIFETLIQVGNRIAIRHMVYVHRYFTRSIVNEIILTRLDNHNNKNSHSLGNYLDLSFFFVTLICFSIKSNLHRSHSHPSASRSRRRRE